MPGTRKSILILSSHEKAFPFSIVVDNFLICCCFYPQALGLQDSDDEAEAEEKAVEEVS